MALAGAVMYRRSAALLFGAGAGIAPAVSRHRTSNRSWPSGRCQELPPPRKLRSPEV